MRILSIEDLELVIGGLDLSGGRVSENVEDLRGIDRGGWIDANGMCWPVDTPSSTMYPDGTNYAGTNYN